MKRVLLVLIALSFFTAHSAAQVTFGDLQLNESNELLFSASSTVPGHGSHRTLLHADASDHSVVQRSVFPERIMRLGDTGRIQVQNRFGVFRNPADEDSSERDAGDRDTNDADGPPRPAPYFTPVSEFPSFVDGGDVRSGKTVAVGSSPDGRYLSYLEPTSPGYGDLILHDIQSDQRTTISQRVELSLDSPPLRWSEDSDYLVYTKENSLYYFSLLHHRNSRTLNEAQRRLGPGGIAAAQWGSGNTLYYLRGSLVYRVQGLELFTRSLYQDVLKVGTVIGKIPYSFDSNFDRFWIAPGGDKILVSKDGRSVNVLFLETDDYTSTGDSLSLPYMYLPRNTRVQTVLWSSQDVVTVLTAGVLHGEQKSQVYRIDLADEAGRSRFSPTEDEGVRGMELSPDGDHVAVWTSEGVSIRHYADWSEARAIEHPGLMHAIWQDRTHLVLAGRHTIERVDVGADTANDAGREVLMLSSADEFGFDSESGVIRARSGESLFELTATGWQRIADEDLAVADTRVAGDEYRVYLEDRTRGSYRNMVMIRDLESYGTEPLFSATRLRYEPFPENDETVDFTNFTHGSRIRRREIALTFNAIDSVAGLTEILNTLAEYDVRATFFLNGDFIQRHPGAVREIAESGHEVGSLFYTYFDMSDDRFELDEEFIKQGLARNEDEYFDVTGRELSLLWHAPYYFSAPSIISAAQEMNYTYIGRDVDSLDWVPFRDESGLSRLYRPTAEIIEEVIAEKQPGSIVAMTVGKPGDDRPDGGRQDYLFHRLDVLMNALIEQGYEIVPISTLMEHAR
ncbi:MAG: polysaccharide deacetylase family protein [Alkalispirochaeta sp.]